MKYFLWGQNNSGGCFEGPPVIIVEAENQEAAEVVAEQYGVYYDGVSEGRDCSCCGDRWYSPEEYETLAEALDRYHWRNERLIVHANGAEVVLRQ